MAQGPSQRGKPHGSRPEIERRCSMKNQKAKTARKSAKTITIQRLNTIFDCETMKDPFMYPVSKDDQGYLIDDKRATHAQVLRHYADRNYGNNDLGCTVHDSAAFRAFLHECAGLIR